MAPCHVCAPFPHLGPLLFLTARASFELTRSWGGRGLGACGEAGADRQREMPVKSDFLDVLIKGDRIP